MPRSDAAFECRVRPPPGLGTRGTASRRRPGLTAGGETHAAQFSRWGLGRRSIPAKQPVMKPTRPSSPGGASAGDPSRLTASLRAAHRCVSVEIHPGQFSRWGLLPHAPCQPGVSPPPGELAGLGAHAGSTTGCSPRRFAPLIVAFRSKYTRASSPGGGFLPHAPCQPDPHRENWASPPPGDWPASALTRVPPQAVKGRDLRTSSSESGKLSYGLAGRISTRARKVASIVEIAALACSATDRLTRFTRSVAARMSSSKASWW